MTTALVLENHPDLALGRAADWLTDTGMGLDVHRAHAGDAVPNSVGGHDALIALGGDAGYWADELRGLIETAVADATPLLAIGASSRLLATCHGAEIEPSEEPNGPRMLAKRDAAGRDILFGPAPMTIDVIRWRGDDLVNLPEEATLLAASPHGALEAFRMRESAWGIQSHFELAAESLEATGAFDQAALAKAAAVDEHIVATWRPIVERFARIVAGERRSLPVVDA